MKHIEKACNKMWKREKMTRKEKKAIFGKRISRKQLREEINNGQLIHCPRCRHNLYTCSTGNMAAYPEIWEYHYCAVCELTISGADNSFPVNLMDVAKVFVAEGENHSQTLYEAVWSIGDDLKDYI